MPDTPLNPDALEAMSRVMNPPAWSVIERYPEDELVIMTKEAELSKAEKLARAYVAVAQPEVNSVEELDKLPIGSIIVPLAYDEPTALLRDQFGTWAVAGLPEPFDTEKIHRALHGKGARIVYIPEVKP